MLRGIVRFAGRPTGVTVRGPCPCADPYLYNCKYDPVQDAIYIAESRAIAYAISKNVIVVAAGALSSIRHDRAPRLVDLSDGQTASKKGLCAAW